MARRPDGQVFESQAKLEKFLILRLRYLFQMLSGTFHNLPEIADAIEGSQHVASLVGSLENLSESSREMLTLQTCDLLLSSSDWSTTWAQVLLQSRSVPEMLGFFETEMGITIQVQAKKSPAKAPESAKTALEGAAGQVKGDGEEKKVQEAKEAPDFQSKESKDATTTTGDGDGSASTAAPAGPVLQIQDGVSLRAINTYKDRGSCS